MAVEKAGVLAVEKVGAMASEDEQLRAAFATLLGREREKPSGKGSGCSHEVTQKRKILVSYNPDEGVVRILQPEGDPIRLLFQAHNASERLWKVARETVGEAVALEMMKITPLPQPPTHPALLDLDIIRKVMRNVDPRRLCWMALTCKRWKEGIKQLQSQPALSHFTVLYWVPEMDMGRVRMVVMAGPGRGFSASMHKMTWSCCSFRVISQSGARGLVELAESGDVAVLSPLKLTVVQLPEWNRGAVRKWVSWVGGFVDANHVLLGCVDSGEVRVGVAGGNEWERVLPWRLAGDKVRGVLVQGRLISAIVRSSPNSASSSSSTTLSLVVANLANLQVLLVGLDASLSKVGVDVILPPNLKLDAAAPNPPTGQAGGIIFFGSHNTLKLVELRLDGAFVLWELLELSRWERRVKLAPALPALLNTLLPPEEPTKEKWGKSEKGKEKAPVKIQGNCRVMERLGQLHFFTDRCSSVHYYDYEQGWVCTEVFPGPVIASGLDLGPLV